MDNSPAQTAAAPAVDSSNGLVNAARVTRSLLKGVSGALALGMGAVFLASGAALPVVIGALALYTGGRQLFETGKELLPLKIQSAVSMLFTGKELTEITPVQQPKTFWGKAFRVAEYVSLAVGGAAAFAFGGFALGMGSQERAMAQLVAGGLGLMAAGTVNVLDQAASGIRALIGLSKKSAPDVTKPAANTAAPDLSPAPALAAKASAASFNQSATPDATPAASTPAADTPKPAAPQPPTV